MNRAAVIEQIRTTQQTLEKLLALLEASGQDRFVSHLYGSRREYRSACDRAGKSGKPIERCLISTLRVAESIGFKGDFRQWVDVLRIGVEPGILALHSRFSKSVDFRQRYNPT